MVAAVMSSVNAALEMGDATGQERRLKAPSDPVNALEFIDDLARKMPR
jgi:hypothetical protein